MLWNAELTTEKVGAALPWKTDASGIAANAAIAATNVAPLLTPTLLTSSCLGLGTISATPTTTEILTITDVLL